VVNGIQEKLKELGGKWNTRLKEQGTGNLLKGWIFPKSKLKELIELLPENTRHPPLIEDK
jgi:hypothetical protein